MLEKIEKTFEWLLWQSRLVVIFAVVSSVAGACVLILIGSYDVWHIVTELPAAFDSSATFKEFQTNALSHIIGAVDSYLIATVLLIFGIGLYELFISKIDALEKDTNSSKVLEVHSLDQLKEKLAKVVLMVLIVIFFKNVLHYHFEDILSLLYLSIGIFLIALSIYFTNKPKDGAGSKKG